MKCSTCGTPTTNICGACDPCVAVEAQAERVAQGLDPIERDPVRAARLAQRLARDSQAVAS